MWHKGESSLSKLSGSSNDEDEEDDGTGAEDINGDSNGNGGGDRDTGAGGRSAEWLRFLSLGARAEVLSAMAKAKASLLTASRKK